jgi:glyoxylase-like metal-dependent hydrolase (beta-lactamase superfamily II)
MTHGHFDHLLGLGYFAKAYPEAAILVHPMIRSFLGLGRLSVTMIFSAR